VSVVSARRLTKSYGPQTLFDDVSLTVREGERVGLLGANGAGKSTLLRILAGLETPDSGAVERRRGARMLYLAQEPVHDAEATPRQLVEQGLSDWHAATRRYAELSRALEEGASSPDHAAWVEEQATLAETIERLGGFTRDHVALTMLEHLGVREVDRPVGTMSGGEKRRVALAQLLVAEPELAVLDEPTNHLDTETIEWLERYLAEEFKGAVLMVTHDRYVLDAIADRVLELDDGKLTEFQGGYADYLEQKAELVAHTERVEQNRLNLLRRERAWLLRGAKARTTKQKARLDRARALMAQSGPKDAAEVSFSGLETGVKRTGKTILDLENASVAIGDRTLVLPLTIRLVTGERMGVIGPNGAGKTSLLRLVSGELTPAAGKVVRGANTSMVYFDQSRSNLRDDWSVFDNVAEREGADRGASDVVRIGDRILQMRTYLEQFSFAGSKQRQKVGALSGGERARVALAKALRGGENLLLLDEPTNDLDVSTLGALEELLVSWPGCAIIVSHDRYFLDRVATSLLVFEGDGVVTRYPGGYESYRSLRAEAEAARAGDTAKPRAEERAAPRPTTPEPGPKPLSFSEKKELEGILDEITALEQSVQTLEAELGSPALYAADPAEARRVRAEHARAQEELLRRTARWEELEARRGVKRA
jgi:ATP-binding cassette subfamily F protein uup